MSAVAPLSVPKALRVKIAAADPQRLAALAELVRELGYFVVPTHGTADVMLSDSVLSRESLPTVALGAHAADHEAVLPAEASLEQIDAALRAVAVGLKVTIGDKAFAALDEA